VKNDRIDSEKIAGLLRSGMLPQAYVYPSEMRSTRDLLRRRLYLSRKHAEIQAHIQNLRYQYNVSAFEKAINKASNRIGIAQRFGDPMVAASVEVDSKLLDALHEQILFIERKLTKEMHLHDPAAIQLLRTIPGIGRTLAMVIVYEVQDIRRFARVGNFISYARLVKCTHESAGKRTSGRNSKIGNVHLKWAFSEAACIFLRANERGQAWHRKLVSKYGKAKSLSIIAQRLGRVAYTILKTRTAFDANRFYESVS
jgi:transposase